jgi:hypothetical protein
MPYMATRLLLTLSHHRYAPPDVIMSSSSTNTGSKRQRHPPRRDFASNTSSEGNQRRSRRPPKHPSPGNHYVTAGNGNSTGGNPKPRPTHFLALPIGHHAELRSAISALTSSWLAHEPPIDGLDPSIIVNPRRLHLTLGVMALTPPSPPNQDSDRQQNSGLNLEGATALLASLAPRIRALLDHSPLRIPLARLAAMQQDPTRVHVLYVEPDLRSPDGRRLRAVCGVCFPSSLLNACLMVYRSRPRCVQGSRLSRRRPSPAKSAPPRPPLIIPSI